MTTLLNAMTDRLPDGRGRALMVRGRTGDGGPAGSSLPDLDQAVLGFLAGAGQAAPYLGRLLKRCDVARLLARAVDDPLADLVPRPGALSGDDLRARLRAAKADAALFAALADLSGVWTMRTATAALSGVADACVEAALRGAWASVAAHRKADIAPPPNGPVPGLGVIAMGKLGSQTLNYSSDIDLIVVFDGDGLPLGPADKMGPRGTAVAVTQAMLSILSDKTPDGYVFRTDMRLRPDPSSSALAVSVGQAERYYERQGQNWERAAHIKARGCAGDRKVTNAYLDVLRPFVWRRTLDFAALSDIRAVGQQIQAQAHNPDIAAAGGDVKLGPGGIREAEFFCEVQQLIFGGREEALRTAQTLDTLTALAQAGHVPSDVATSLAQAYTVLRDAEHRLQMVEDEPTQTLPEGDEARADIATLFGAPDLAAFDAQVLVALGTIHDAYADLFGAEDAGGTLVFTGVDDDPRTIRTLTEMGFEQPAAAARTVRGWHQGDLGAARSVRARELLTALVPKILRACANADDPDAAFGATARFLAVLPSGLGIFGLFTAHQEVLVDVVTLCAASPELARQMGQRPALVLALLAGEERADLPAAPSSASSSVPGLEGEMDAVRVHVQGGRLRAAAALTLGRGDPYGVGAELSDLADAAIVRLSDAVAQSLAASGPPLAVIAFGRLGAGCLTVSSDLDIVFVYDGDAQSAPAALKRVRRLVAALSAPTAQGELYEVDMKLRPSGGSGPAAVSLSAFERYYDEAAQTWELMALTKARVVLGDADLCARLDGVINTILARSRPDGDVLSDAAIMRAKLLAGHPPRGPLDVKRLAGGLTDIDFISQGLGLIAPMRLPRATPDGIAALADAGVLGADDAQTLVSAHALFEGVAQYARATFGAVPAGGLTSAQEGALAKLCGAASPTHDDVAKAAEAVRDVFARTIGAHP